MKLTVTTKDGKPVVVDETGKTLDWVELVVVEVKKGFQPTIYLGSSTFEGAVTIGSETPLIQGANPGPAMPDQPPAHAGA